MPNLQTETPRQQFSNDNKITVVIVCFCQSDKESKEKE